MWASPALRGDGFDKLARGPVVVRHALNRRHELSVSGLSVGQSLGPPIGLQVVPNCLFAPNRTRKFVGPYACGCLFRGGGGGLGGLGGKGEGERVITRNVTRDIVTVSAFAGFAFGLQFRSTAGLAFSSGSVSLDRHSLCDFEKISRRQPLLDQQAHGF